MTPDKIKARMLARFTKYPTDRWNDIKDVLDAYAEVCAELLAEQQKPVATREAVLNYVTNNVDQYVRYVLTSSGTADLILAAISYFAPSAHEMMTKMAPGKRMMIEGMSEETIAGWIENDLGASLERPLSTYAGISPAYLIKAAARTVHRLANTPAPEVDPVEERAKEMAWLQYTEAGGGHRKDAAALWHGFDSAAKNGWLAVANTPAPEVDPVEERAKIGKAFRYIIGQSPHAMSHSELGEHVVSMIRLAVARMSMERGA